jgi:ribosome-binding factor A
LNSEAHPPSANPHRKARVAEAVREELAEIVGFELDDPRLAGLTVGDVQISPDSRHARVKVIQDAGASEQRQALAALDHARNYLRHELATRLNLRKVPELHFEIDRWAEADSRIDILLKRAKKKRGSTENQA